MVKQFTIRTHAYNENLHRKSFVLKIMIDGKVKNILVIHLAQVRLVGTVAAPTKSPPCLAEQATVPAVKEMIVAIGFQLEGSG